jgi:hypothetical protein
MVGRYLPTCDSRQVAYLPQFCYCGFGGASSSPPLPARSVRNSTGIFLKLVAERNFSREAIGADDGGDGGAQFLFVAGGHSFP